VRSAAEPQAKNETTAIRKGCHSLDDGSQSVIDADGHPLRQCFGEADTP
jgi:hypothetical protein